MIIKSKVITHNLGKKIGFDGVWNSDSKRSSISSTVIERLGLKSTGHETNKKVYKCGIRFSNGFKLDSFEFIEDDSNKDFVLGMDMINHKDFPITPDGRKRI